MAFNRRVAGSADRSEFSMTENSALLTNQELAESTLAALADLGTKTLCICPGARNSPWISLLVNDSRFEILRFFDERSAAFFALGRARSTERPVAVVTTSGTAVGELYPAMMEAFYTGAQLIALTADRPKRFRGTGAPQACEQASIFGIYTRTSADWDRETNRTEVQKSAAGITRSTWPAHWNVSFEEPLPSHESNRKNHSPAKHSETGIEKCRFPLLIIGELSNDEATYLLPILKRSRLPVITETLSQLRETSELNHLRIQPHRDLWKEALASGYPIDGVIRFGGIPTLRFWRDLEVHPMASQIPVTTFSLDRNGGGVYPFRGLPRARLEIQPEVDWLAGLGVDCDISGWKEVQTLRSKDLETFLNRLSLSEPAWFRQLSQLIAPRSEVYLGNSLPIREWDLAACTRDRRWSIRANRGLNGIDGQISSFFGGLKNDRENWAILGDLTTLYDSNAPWIIPQLAHDLKWRLVVINNSGGRIFDRIFKSDQYTNSHDLNFSAWANHWRLTHTLISDPKELPVAIQARTQVLEMVPDAGETAEFWNLWEPGI